MAMRLVLLGSEKSRYSDPSRSNRAVGAGPSPTDHPLVPCLSIQYPTLSRLIAIDVVLVTILSPRASGVTSTEVTVAPARLSSVGTAVLREFMPYTWKATTSLPTRICDNFPGNGLDVGILDSYQSTVP